MTYKLHVRLLAGYPSPLRISAKMYTASVLLSLFAAGVAFADSSYHSGYSQSTESCSIVNTKNGPELSCQCKINDTDKKPCTISLNSILVNNKQGQLQYYPG